MTCVDRDDPETIENSMVSDRPSDLQNVRIDNNIIVKAMESSVF
jgi:hypothetical protein